MKVAIATTSTEKIAGVIEAISRFFNVKESEIELFSMAVESGVPEQPFGDETYQGALNRANGIRKAFKEMDFYISCEAGIEKAFDQYLETL